MVTELDTQTDTICQLGKLPAIDPPCLFTPTKLCPSQPTLGTQCFHSFYTCYSIKEKIKSLPSRLDLNPIFNHIQSIEKA